MIEREKVGALRCFASSCLCTVLALFLFSCSGGVPSESDARDVFASKYKEQIDQGLVQIDSFKKVNGQRMEVFGVEYYNLEYRATISWPKGLNTQCLKGNKAFKGWNCWMVETREVGEVENSKGKIAFGKTENGWKADDAEVY